jgi:hypothetical protein
MITEQRLTGWDNKLLPFGNVKYPQTLDNNAPKNYFVSIFCGARGSGKTFLLTKLLKTLEQKKMYYEGKIVPQRIILISTTAHSDSNRVFKTLKNLDWENDIIDNYNDDDLLAKINEVKQDLDDAKGYKLYKSAWLKFMKDDENLINLNDEEIMILSKYGYVDFKDIPKPKYPEGFLIHWIIDDMIGTNIFKNGRSAFTNLCTRNRHIIPGNIIIATQSMMMIPKTIRLNSNLIVLFKFANKQSILNDIYPVVSAYVNEDDLMALYSYATNEPHNALVIDGTSGKIIFKKNFDILLTINSN